MNPLSYPSHNSYPILINIIYICHQLLFYSISPHFHDHNNNFNISLIIMQTSTQPVIKILEYRNGLYQG